MKRHLQCAEQQISSTNVTKYCGCHVKMALMIDARHILNVIYNGRSNRHHPPTSPNTAPATQNCIPKSEGTIIPTKVLVSHPGSLVSPDKGSLDVQSRGYHHSGRGWNSCQELRMGGLLPFSIFDMNSETLLGEKYKSLIPK